MTSKAITLIAALIFISINALSAQNCTASKGLRDLYGFQSLQNSTVPNGAKYCKSLKNANSCCNADTMNSISTMSGAATSQVVNVIAARDRYLVKVRDQVIPQLQSSMQGLSSVADTFFADAGGMNSSFSSLSSSSSSSPSNLVLNGNNQQGSGSGSGPAAGPVNFTTVQNLDQVKDTVGVLQVVADTLMNTLPTLRSNFSNFQKARSTCVTELIKLQAASYCFACDPNNTMKGYNASTGAIKLSPRVCQRLQGSCYDFVEQSAGQNLILTAAALSPVFTQATASINKLLNGDATGAASFGNNTIAHNETGNGGVKEETAAMFPEDCVRGNCTWICDHFFANGQLDQETLGAGGDLTSSGGSGSSSSRLLIEDLIRGNAGTARRLEDRMLGSNDGFDPDTDEAGVDVVVSNDPGNTNSKGGAALVLNVAISVMVVAMSLMM